MDKRPATMKSEKNTDELRDYIRSAFDAALDFSVWLAILGEHFAPARECRGGRPRGRSSFSFYPLKT